MSRITTEQLDALASLVSQLKIEPTDTARYLVWVSALCNVAPVLIEAASQHADALDRAEKAERERNEARRERDIFQRDRAVLYDKLNGTPCAEVRWQQERDALRALIARAVEAIKPFSALTPSDAERPDNTVVQISVYLGDLRRGATALEILKEALR